MVVFVYAAERVAERRDFDAGYRRQGGGGTWLREERGPGHRAGSGKGHGHLSIPRDGSHSPPVPLNPFIVSERLAHSRKETTWMKRSGSIQGHSCISSRSTTLTELPELDASRSFQNGIRDRQVEPRS